MPKNYENDFLLAKRLQNEFNKELKQKSPIKVRGLDDANNVRSISSDLNATQNLVHPDWEFVDPTPDIQAMFTEFDEKFFQRRLLCVTLEWSKKMYSCAGICYSRKNRFGMQCTIRLSEPLLKLRSRKNLVETLLHEMIHAYLFIQGIREENGGHGPNFKRIMTGINRVAGTHITVYHSFYDEVAAYKTHWWRCNGICQHRKPFFGYVRRTCNRAPGPNDRWWAVHQSTCTGTFEKIKEPESKKTKKQKTNSPNIPTKKQPDLRKYFGPGQVKGGVSNRGGGTIVIKKPPSTKPATVTSSEIQKPINNSGNLSNVVGLGDFAETSPTRSNNKKPTNLFSGSGRTLSTESPINNRLKTPENIQNNLRNVWSKRYATEELKTDDDIKTEIKRPKIVEHELDDDLCIYEDIIPLINIQDSDDDFNNDDDDDDIVEILDKKKIIKKETIEERKNSILSDIRNTGDITEMDDDIMLIDDEYDDNLRSISEIADTSVIDDLFGEDTLLNEHGSSTRHSDVTCTSSSIISCPICQEYMERDELSSHLEGCQGIKKIIRPKVKVLSKYNPPENKKKNKPKNKLTNLNQTNNEIKRTLLAAGYSENELKSLLDNDSSSNSIMDNSNMNNTVVELDNSGIVCPVCNKSQVGDINEHLDNCLL